MGGRECLLRPADQPQETVAEAPPRRHSTQARQGSPQAVGVALPITLFDPAAPRAGRKALADLAA